MPDDDIDDTAEIIGTPLNVELNPLDDAADAAQDQDTSDDEPPGFDVGSMKPNTGFSSGH